MALPAVPSGSDESKRGAPTSQQQPRVDQPPNGKLAADQHASVVKILSGIKGSGSADRTKVLERIASELTEVQRQLARRSATDNGGGAELTELLTRNAVEFGMQVDAAWEHADALKVALVQIGDDAYLGALLENELIRQKSERRLSWSQYLDGHELETLVERFRDESVNDAQRARGIAGLTFMFEKRRDDGTHLRARNTLRSRTLLLVFLLLAPIVVLVTTTSWAAYATYAFIAGFSEPFLLGVVARVAGSNSS